MPTCTSYECQAQRRKTAHLLHSACPGKPEDIGKLPVKHTPLHSNISGSTVPDHRRLPYSLVDTCKHVELDHMFLHSCRFVRNHQETLSKESFLIGCFSPVPYSVSNGRDGTEEEKEILHVRGIKVDIFYYHSVVCSLFLVVSELACLAALFSFDTGPIL